MINDAVEAEEMMAEMDIDPVLIWEDLYESERVTMKILNCFLKEAAVVAVVVVNCD